MVVVVVVVVVIVVCVCGVSVVHLRCACSAPAVPLLCAYSVVVFYSVIAVNWLRSGSYILASNTVEFNMPAYPGLYPSFLVL